MYYIHILFVIANKTLPKLNSFGVYGLSYHAYELAFLTIPHCVLPCTHRPYKHFEVVGY